MTRDTIKQGIADLAWWMQWSDHVEEHRCCNLSGCKISEIAPETPPEYLEGAEKALTEVETKINQHEALQQAIRAALGHADARQAEEVSTSEVCGALLAAAVADADPSLYDDQEYAQRFGHCIAYYDTEHALDKFYDGSADDGWKAVSIAKARSQRHLETMLDLE